MQVHQPIREKQKALRELKYREDIVTANTHKGRELVAADVKRLYKKSEIHLKNSEHQKYLEHDVVTENNTIVYKFITRLKNDS